MTNAMDVLRLLSEFTMVALVPLLIWNARLMVEFRDGLREMRQAMYGVNGTNGMNSEIKALRAARHRSDTLLTEHAFRIEEHHNLLTEIKARLP